MFYPDVSIIVFDRNNKIAFECKKVQQLIWDERLNKELLQIDSYHYIIDLGNDDFITGQVTIIYLLIII